MNRFNSKILNATDEIINKRRCGIRRKNVILKKICSAYKRSIKNKEIDILKKHCDVNKKLVPTKPKFKICIYK